MPGLAGESKELRKKLADRDETDATPKTTPKCRGKKRATAVSKWIIALEAELEKAKTAQARLADILARSKTDAFNARSGLNLFRVRLGKAK